MQVMALSGRDEDREPTVSDALPGRQDPITVPDSHAVFPDRRIAPPFPSLRRSAAAALID
jgi:peptide-methionine (S)-S-oxide reductase